MDFDGLEPIRSIFIVPTTGKINGYATAATVSGKGATSCMTCCTERRGVQVCDSEFLELKSSKIAWS